MIMEDFSLVIPSASHVLVITAMFMKLRQKLAQKVE